jgi:YidC/Oxa1 family membrane protein insertase
MSLSAALDAVIGVAHATIEALATLLSPIAGGSAAAVAIVLFTVVVRLLISPLSYLQIRNERRRAALAPRLTELQRRHRDDPATLVSETFALYRANGAGPVAGLLPGLAQAPFFMIMYRVALDAPVGSFLGVPLSAHLFAGAPAFAVLLVIAAALAWLSSRRIRRTAAVAPSRTMPPDEEGATGNGGGVTRPVGGRRATGNGGGVTRPVGGRRATGNDGGVTRPVDGRATGNGGGVTRPVGARAARGGGETRPDQERVTRTGGRLAAMMPWLPFAALPAVAWLPLAGALYLVTSMAWTAVERSVAFAFNS